MNPEQWLSLKWNGGSTMSDRWLNQSKIIQKKQEIVRKMMDQIELSDIKIAIQRGKKISKDNQDKVQNKTPEGNGYYNNPDTQMHILLQFLFAKIGIKIE